MIPDSVDHEDGCRGVAACFVMFACLATICVSLLDTYINQDSHLLWALLGVVCGVVAVGSLALGLMVLRTLSKNGNFIKAPLFGFRASIATAAGCVLALFMIAYSIDGGGSAEVLLVAVIAAGASVFAAAYMVANSAAVRPSE